MEILSLHVERGFAQRESVDRLPEKGYLWLDYERDDTAQWAADIERLTGVKLHEGHVRDGLNPTHPSFYDSTSDYEMLINEGRIPQTPIGLLILFRIRRWI